MTSVQNHRLPLNGSKNLLWLAIFASFFFVQGCSILFPDRKPKDKETRLPIPDTDTIIVEDLIDTMELLFPLIVKDTYNIAFLYPLQLDQKEYELSRRAKNMKEAALEYHKGVLLALDTLKNCGYNFNVFIYDLDYNLKDLSKVIDFLEVNKIDLVFGPFLSSQILNIENFNKENQINTVSSITNFNQCEFDNPYYFFSRPNSFYYSKIASDIVNNQFEKVSVLVVRHNNKQEEIIAKQFIAEIDTLIIPTSNIHEVVIKDGKWERLVVPTGKLSKNNIIFIPNNNEEFVSTIFSQIRNYDREFTIIGMERWPFFKNMDGRLWERFNVHVITPYNIDYNNKTTNQFIQDFRKAYYSEPGEFAFTGFDESIFYLSQLINYGVYFQRYILEKNTYHAPKPVQLLRTKYDFQFIHECNGWQNTYLHLLKYENHRLVKIR